MGEGPAGRRDHGDGPGEADQRIHHGQPQRGHQPAGGDCAGAARLRHGHRLGQPLHRRPDQQSL